jgi:RNA polymerase sigma-54 factor
MPQPPGAGELEAALARVQALDPPGVGARDVLECLRLQLPAVPDPLERAACARLLDACGSATPFDPRRLSRVMGCGDAALQRLLSCLRRLDPHPGWRYGCDETRYVLPDVIAVRSRRAWRVVLNDAVIPRIRLNAVYAELYQRHKAPAGTELGVKLQDARWTVRNLHQRFATILDVAQAILRRQSPFLDHGPMAMRPLGLAEIAQELDMHESTVSRATHEKYIATPAGTFELKYFFSRAISAGTGHASSPTAIRALVGEIIAREHPAAPLSDVAVTRQLARRGIAIARRTVTKYRQQLGIPAADERGDAGVRRRARQLPGYGMTRYFTKAGQHDILIVDLSDQGRALQIHLSSRAIRETLGASDGFLSLIDAVRDRLPAIEKLALAKAGDTSTEVFLDTQDLAQLHNS